MKDYNANAPKAPRWIRTEAGQWAWREQLPWRGDAAKALSVDDRLRLLQEAERLQKTQDSR
jgi:hypothetical protein